MQITQALLDIIESELSSIKKDTLIKDAQMISLRYRTQGGKGDRLLTEDSEALAYAAARMPATYGAVMDALKGVLSLTDISPKTLLDVGAGTGAASLAADELFKLTDIMCLEREASMIKIGRAVMKEGSAILKNARWVCCDITKHKIEEKFDLTIAAYVLNEMSEEKREDIIEFLWDATNTVLLVVEPGTPIGFSNIEKVRKYLLGLGAHIIAPCPHEMDCPKAQKDWCHFTCRISRSKLHRELKGGEAPFEDEKFIYMAFSHEKIQNSSAQFGRVLRHPQIRSGHIMLEVCTKENILNIKLSKKDGEKYKQARKAKAGDIIFI